jgi:ribonuclease HI
VPRARPKNQKLPERAPDKGLSSLDPSEGIALYTDGSAWSKDRSGGWSWIAIDCGEGEAWDCGGVSATTVNRMELQAWIEGLNTLKVFGPLIVLVRSDSEYVGLGAMDRKRIRNKNRDLWEQLDEAIDAHELVHFDHVRGHSGNKYNDRVDVLANQARRSLQ